MLDCRQVEVFYTIYGGLDIQMLLLSSNKALVLRWSVCFRLIEIYGDKEPQELVQDDCHAMGALGVLSQSACHDLYAFCQHVTIYICDFLKNLPTS